MPRLGIIQKIINAVGCRTYVEIGVRYGTVFFKMKAPRKFAVDPHFQISSLKKLFFIKDFFKNNFFEKTSDDFFNGNSDLFEKEKIDVVFIDGLHTYEQSLRDVTNSLRFLSEKGVIIMHDCNPTTSKMAVPSLEEFQNTPGEGKGWCGDVWKTIVHIRSQSSDLNAFVLNCDYGVGIIYRGITENPLTFVQDEIKKMNYDELEKNREGLLNLKDPSYLDEFVSILHDRK